MLIFGASMGKLYESPHWKASVIQIKCLKIILKMPRYHSKNDLHNRAIIPPISKQISKINFRAKLSRSENPPMSK